MLLVVIPVVSSDNISFTVIYSNGVIDDTVSSKGWRLASLLADWSMYLKIGRLGRSPDRALVGDWWRGEN